jgi:hypothetical protein
LRELNTPYTGLEVLVESLRGEMPDDAWDEDEALELLNEHTPLHWEFRDGDVIALVR